MLSSESRPAMNVPQHGPGFLQDRAMVRLPQSRKSAHGSHFDYNLQGTRSSHRPQSLWSPEQRREPPSIAKGVVHVRRALQQPERRGVHRMPPELLGIIFENCFDERAPSHTVLPENPLVLGRVCSYWRSVSQKTPQLWTSLSLRFLETNVDRSRDGVKVVNAVETWLRRSHPTPLSINFTDNRVFQKDTEEVIISLLSRIRMHAPRWKAIHLKFSSDYFIQLNALSFYAFTALTSFSLHTDHLGWRRSLLSLRLDLSQASQLTSLAYTGPDHVIREIISVDWERLTSVAFSYDLYEAGGQGATLPRHFSTLALCKNLAELSIGLSSSLGQYRHHLDALAQGKTTIELPRLHTLRVRRLSRIVHACVLLDALRLPQLSTLCIESAILMNWDSLQTAFPNPDAHAPFVQTHWWHAHHFSALLDRSGCHLDALHIRNVDMSPSELARLLTSPSTLPTLSTFTFEPCPRTYSISDVLAYLVPLPDSGSGSVATSGHRSSAFPSLTHVRLACADETHLDPIADLIESRTGDRATCAGVRPLSVFELVFYDFVYSRGPHGRGRQPSRKACFDAFRERVLRCAREGRVDVDIKVERPYEPVYLSVSS